MFASFYYIDKSYIDYLKETEIKHRGFTCVPNVEYANKTKFLYGVVMERIVDGNHIPYFVPVTSNDKKFDDAILIKIKKNKILENVGSLRFNFMIPVPLRCVRKVDFNNIEFPNEYKELLEQEYRYIKKTIKQVNIQKQAKKTYHKVTHRNNESLIKNSCDFLLLEEAYMEYIKKNKGGDAGGNSEKKSEPISSDSKETDSIKVEDSKNAQEDISQSLTASNFSEENTIETDVAENNQNAPSENNKDVEDSLDDYDIEL